MNRSLVLLVLSACLLVPFIEADGPQEPQDALSNAPTVQPLLSAHAHNDYVHDRPLFDALSQGFCSVEADVFLIDDQLLVGHSRSELTADRTLTALYLDPLLDRVRQNGGRVYQDGPDFTLLIDIKSEGEETYLALDALLSNYAEMLTSVLSGEIRIKAVTVIISGNRAWSTISSDSTRFAGVDGRLPDVSSDSPHHLMPLISDRWGKFFTWAGDGPMPDSERNKLRDIVNAAHAEGRRIRFWATPDHPSPERTALWNELILAGVDLIGTDDLVGLRCFLLSKDDVR